MATVTVDHLRDEELAALGRVLWHAAAVQSERDRILQAINESATPTGRALLASARELVDALARWNTAKAIVDRCALGRAS